MLNSEPGRSSRVVLKKAGEFRRNSTISSSNLKTTQLIRNQHNKVRPRTVSARLSAPGGIAWKLWPL